MIHFEQKKSVVSWVVGNQGDSGTVEENNSSRYICQHILRSQQADKYIERTRLNAVMPNAVMESVEREFAGVWALLLGKVTSEVTERE